MILHNPEPRDNAPIQRELDLDAVPAILREHGLQAAHPRPLVSMGQAANHYTSGRTSPQRAWQFNEVEYGNAGAVQAALILDIDDPDSFFKADLPPANLRVYRPSSGKCHAIWTLEKPVHRYSSARRGPIDNLARIAEFYTHEAGADLGYAGILAHNPDVQGVEEQPYETVRGVVRPYSLRHLAEVIPFNWRPPRIKVSGIGRNVDLHKAALKWAGEDRNRAYDVLACVMALNAKLEVPLSLSEVRGIAKPVEKYRARWAANGWHKPAWLRKQAWRGQRGGLKGGRSGGLKPSNGPIRQSVQPDVTNEQAEPWADEGISRRTWYRKRAGFEFGT